MKRTGVAVIILLSAGLAAFASWSCQRGYTGPVESITIGAIGNAGDTLIFVADEQGHFAANGLNVILKTYTNGPVSTDAMLAGAADLAYTTEYVVVEKALQKMDVSIVATYSKAEAVSLLGLKGRGIEKISDLKGKTIGLARGTINEFYLGRLLQLNGLSMKDVTIVDVNPAEVGDALNGGRVDAGIVGSRYLYPIIQQLGDKVFIWPAQSDQPAYGILVGKKDWVTQHPELVKRLLESLSEAEQYVNRNPDKAKAAVQRKLNFNDEDMATVWSGYQFSLSLDQSLIVAMEDEARWMISNNLTKEKTVPDFTDYIYEDGLKAVKPAAVSLIR